MSGMESFQNVVRQESAEPAFATPEAMTSAVIAAAEHAYVEANEQYAERVGGNENQKNLKYKNRLGNVFTTSFAVALDRLGFGPDEAANTAVFTYGLLLSEGHTLTQFAQHVKEVIKKIFSQVEVFPLSGSES